MGAQTCHTPLSDRNRNAHCNHLCSGWRAPSCFLTSSPSWSYTHMPERLTQLQLTLDATILSTHHPYPATAISTSCQRRANTQHNSSTCIQGVGLPSSALTRSSSLLLASSGLVHEGPAPPPPPPPTAAGPATNAPGSAVVAGGELRAPAVVAPAAVDDAAAASVAAGNSPFC